MYNPTFPTTFPLQNIYTMSPIIYNLQTITFDNSVEKAIAKQQI